MNEERAIRTILVAGGGIVALSAATAFARSLPRTLVTLLRTPRDLAALADLLPVAGPGVHQFHGLLALDEQELIRTGAATHHLGTNLHAWPGEWTQAFGAHGRPVGAVHFDQVWARAWAAGRALAYDRYSVAAALARADKFVHPNPRPNSLGSQFGYGLRLDSEAYPRSLHAAAEAAGVSFTDGDIHEVELEAGDQNRVAAVRLSDGSRLQVDLFVDCTGPGAVLLGAVDKSFEEWRAWFPFCRIQVSEITSSGIPAVAASARADQHGWTGEWSLRGRTLVVRSGREEGLQLNYGRRLRPWVGNVLALGDAMAALDGQHALGLDLAHKAILLALELLPGRDMNVLETGEFNRRAEQITRRIRDYLALHYLRGPWSDLHSTEAPDSLAHTLDQYQHRGRLPFHEEETVTRDSWTAALIGMEVLPRNTDPHALSVPLEKAIAAMRGLAREIEETVAQLPSYGDYLARITR